MNWIPVWEKLPELNDEVFRGLDGEEWKESDIVLVCAGSPDDLQYGLGQYIKNLNGEYVGESWIGVTHDEYNLDRLPVYAWMPLPGLPKIEYNNKRGKV